MSSRILVVEHDEAMVESLEAALHREGLETVSAVDGASALQTFHQTRPDAVLLAVQLGDESGVEVCQALREAPRGQLVPILFMGNSAEGSVVRSPGDALSHGGDYFFPLPNDLDYLAGRVRGWTSDADEASSGPLLRSDTRFDSDPEFEESVTEHGFAPALAQRMKSNGESNGEEDVSVSLVHQAEALRSAGRTREAIEVYAAAAAMYETDDEIGPALAIYKLILGLEPGEYDIARHAGQLAGREGKKKDALEIYGRTADALEARGQLENATFLIHEMLRIEPSQDALWRRLQELELALGMEAKRDEVTFDDLIAKEIGLNLHAATLELAALPEDDDILSQDTLHIINSDSDVLEIVELDDEPEPNHVRGMVSDLSVPEALPAIEVLEALETPDWSNLLAAAELPVPANDEPEPDPVNEPEPEPESDDPRPPISLEVTARLPIPSRVPDSDPSPDIEDDDSDLPEWSDRSAANTREETPAAVPKPMTISGWSQRLPVWDDRERSAAPLLSKIPPPTYGSASMISPSRVVPVDGIASNLSDVVRLLARIDEQRATGILGVGGAPQIAFVDGQPAALRGHPAVNAFLSLLLASGKVDESACRDLLASGRSERPVEVARMFVRYGLLKEQEGTVFLHRHFEDGVAALLRRQGTWEFDGSEKVEVVREEIVPEMDDVRRLLIDLLPRIADKEELLDAVGGPAARVRVSALAEDGPSRDARFLAILDGRYELQEAAELASMPLERATALALVYLLFGLATVVQHRRPKSHPDWIPLSQPTGGEPVLSSRPRRVKPVQIKRSVEQQLDAAGRLRALADLVNANDYFVIFGLDPTSHHAEVRDAHARLIDLIDADAIAIDPELVELAGEVRRALDEARDVLVNPVLRAAYLDHLQP